MKKLAFILIIFLTNPTLGLAQCYLPFIIKDCYLDSQLSLSENWKETMNRQLQNWGIDSHEFKKCRIIDTTINSVKYSVSLDSVYKVCIRFLIENIGEQNMCERMDLHNVTIRPTRYLSDLKKGEIVFRYYYSSPRKCWSDMSDRITFRYEQRQDLGFNIEFPEYLPECKPKENCQYVQLTRAEWIDKAILDGYIDGTEDVDIIRSQLKYQVLKYSNEVFRDRLLMYSLRSGEIVKDTFINQLAYWRRDSHLEFRKADLIIDGTTISIESFDLTPYSRLNNYFIEVHHIIKGDVKVDTIIATALTGSHGIRMPRVGERAILYLNKDTKNRSLKENNPLKDTEANIYYPYINSTIWKINNNTKFYTGLVASITELENVKTISPPCCTDNKIYQSLKSRFGENACQKNGILAKVDWEFWNLDNSHWMSHLYAFSSNDYTYPTSMRFVLTYDTTYIDANIVKQNRFNVSRKAYYATTSDRMPEMTLSDNYKITYSDIGPNTIELQIKSKDNSKLCQLPIIDGSKHYDYKPLLSIAVDMEGIEDLEHNFRLELIQDHNSPGKYLNPVKGTFQDYAYAYLLSREKTIMKTRHHQIDSVTFKTFNIGDTVTIHGKYLKAFKDEIFHPCHITIAGTDFLRHCRVREEDILECSSDIIKYTIPDLFKFRESFGKTDINMLPTSGTIKIKYKQSHHCEQKVE